MPCPFESGTATRAACSWTSNPVVRQSPPLVHQPPLHSTIKEFEASTGSTVSEFWPVHESRYPKCHMHCPTTAWDILQMIPSCFGTRQVVKTCLARSRPTPQDIYSVALSPDGRFLAIGGHNKKIVIKDLRDVLPILSTVSIVYCWIMTYPNGFTANPPYFDVNSTQTLIALSLSYQSLTSPALHSISGRTRITHSPTRLL